MDHIRPGLGMDDVNGGADYSIGDEVEIIPAPDDEGFEDIDQVLAIIDATRSQRTGEIFKLDYSLVTTGGVLSTVGIVRSEWRNTSRSETKALLW